MMKPAIKMLMLTFIISVSSFVIAQTTTGSSDLASQIETRLTGVAPNTVIISVDESAKTARLSGTVSTQADMERMTEVLRGVSGVRVIGSDLRLNQTGTSTHSMETGKELEHSTDMPSGTSVETDNATTMDQDGSDSMPDTASDPNTTLGTEGMGTPGSIETGDTLIAQIEQAFMDVPQDTAVIIVDESTKTAVVRGNFASQSEVDRITSSIGTISGLRVVNTALSAPSDVDHSEHHQQPTLSGGTSGNPSEDDAERTTTRTTMTTSDASLRAAVEAALKSEGIMGQSKIAVETENGIVTLTGAALSESHADRIVALAMSVPGVVRVEPNITLRDQKRRYQVKPSSDRDKKGHEVGSGESRVPDDRKGDVDVDVELDNPDATDDEDDDNE